MYVVLASGNNLYRLSAFYLKIPQCVQHIPKNDVTLLFSHDGCKYISKAQGVLRHNLKYRG